MAGNVVSGLRRGALPGLVTVAVLLGAGAVQAQQLYPRQTASQCKALGGYITTWTSSAPGVARAMGRPDLEGGPQVGECYVPPQVSSPSPRSYTAPSTSYGGSGGGGGNRVLNGLSGIFGAAAALLEMQQQREEQEEAERRAFAAAQNQAAVERADYLNKAGLQHEGNAEWGAALRAFEAAADALPSDDFENAAVIRRNIARMREKADAEAKRQQEASARNSVVANLPPSNPFPSASSSPGAGAAPNGTNPAAPTAASELENALARRRCVNNPNPSICELIAVADIRKGRGLQTNMPFNCGHAKGEWVGDTVKGFCQLPGQPPRVYSTAGKAQEYSAILRNDFRRWREARLANAKLAEISLSEDIRRSMAMIMLSTASMDPDAALEILRDVTPLVQQVADYTPSDDKFALPKKNPF